jgi:hypothetical protein
MKCNLILYPFLTYLFFVQSLAGQQLIPESTGSTIAGTAYFDYKTVGFDSTTECGTTRYYSEFEVFYHLELLEEPDISSFSFHLYCAVPGDFCGDSLVVATLATEEGGATLPSSAINLADTNRTGKTLAELEVTINSDQAVDGGICIVVESIDPGKVDPPVIHAVSDWKICIENEWEKVLGMQKSKIEEPYLPAPEYPSCEECDLD